MLCPSLTARYGRLWVNFGGYSLAAFGSTLGYKGA